MDSSPMKSGRNLLKRMSMPGGVGEGKSSRRGYRRG